MHKQAAALATMVLIGLGGCAAFVATLDGCAGLIGANFDRGPSGEAGDDEAGLDAGDGGPSPFTVVNVLPVGETFWAVYAADANNVYVVGSSGAHDDFYEGTWHRNDGISGRDYYAIWGVSPTEAYCVGTIADGRGIIQRYDGSNWKDEYISDSGLYGVWGIGNLVYAVGAKGMIYGKQKGTTSWAARLSMGLPANPKVPTDPNSPILYGISGNNGNDFAMAAGQDRVFHYEGSGNFINLDPAIDRTISFRSVWGPPASQTNVFFGTNYLGVAWLSAPRAAPGLDATIQNDTVIKIHQEQGIKGAKDLYVNGIWGAGSSVVFAGDLGRIFQFDIATDTFTTVPSPSNLSLNGVSGTSLSDLWIVGANELVMHGSL